MSKTPPKKRQALILVAHADDETLGAGGTIVKLARGGWNAQVVILSDGIVRVRGKVQDNREDAKTACRVLGVGEPRFLGFADQKFDSVPVADLAGAVANLGLEPDLVITHAETDLNGDHRLACEAAKIVARPKGRPISLLACEIPNTTLWNGRPFAANYYVDIRGTLERKVAAFSSYRNELRPYPHPWSRKGLKLLAEYHGMQSGLGMAEAFSLVRGYEGLLP